MAVLKKNNQKNNIIVKAITSLNLLYELLFIILYRRIIVKTKYTALLKYRL